MKNKRQLQAEATKKRIYDTAVELIESRGYDAITIQDITESCGVSKGLFYHYFSSKDELLSYVERDPYQNLAAEIAGMHASFLEKLRFYIRTRLEMMCNNDLQFTRQWLIHAINASYKEQYGADTKVNYDQKMILELLMDGIKCGSLRPETPVYLLAQVINSTLYGTTLGYCINAGDFDMPTWIISYVNYIETDILAKYLSHPPK